MSWAAAMRLGMAEGDALALAREAGQLRGHLRRSIFAKWAQDGMVQLLLEEHAAVQAGTREAFFLSDSNTAARHAFRESYFDLVRSRDDVRRPLEDADLDDEQLRALAASIEAKFRPLSTQNNPTRAQALSPLEAARAALAISQATSYGGLAVEHVMIEEMGQVLAGNPGAAHFSSRANRDDRNALRKQVARNAEAVKAMPSDEQDRVIAQFASEIRGSGKRPAASQ